MAQDVTIRITDREGITHEVQAPTDMNMNIMELCRSYELPVEGRCGGMAMCATCQCYLESDTELPEQSDADHRSGQKRIRSMETGQIVCNVRMECCPSGRN